IEYFMSCADLLLFPSEYESFGLAALEAMSSEVPVVASRAGGLPEVIDHERTGYLAPVGDVDEFAKWALHALSDDALRAEMGRRARQSVHEKFLPQQIIPMYEALYERVLRESSPVN